MREPPKGSRPFELMSPKEVESFVTFASGVTGDRAVKWGLGCLEFTIAALRVHIERSLKENA